MENIRDFLRSEKTGDWFYVAFWWALAAAGCVVLIFLVVLAELGSTMLSADATVGFVASASAAVLCGYLMGHVEYLKWEQDRRHSRIVCNWPGRRS